MAGNRTASTGGRSEWNPVKMDASNQRSPEPLVDNHLTYEEPERGFRVFTVNV